MDLRIEPVEPADFREVHALLSDPEVADHLGGTPADRPEDWRAQLAEAELDRVFRLKALAGGSLAGIVNLEIERGLRRRHVGRLWIAVGRAHQGRGVGTRLLSTMIEAAERWMGLTRLELDVHVGNAAAVRLYEKLGFVIEARRRGGDMIGAGELRDAFAMARLRPGFDPQPAPPIPLPARAPSRLEVRFRPISTDDAPAIAAIQRDAAVLRGVLQQPLAPAELWRRRLEAIDGRQHHLLGAEARGRLVGLGGLHGYGNPRLVHARELGMTVAAEAQGAGVGRALLEQLVELGERFLGLRRIELTVYTDNERAVRIYRRAGFEEEGRRRAFAFREGGYADVIVMSRVR